MTFSLTHTASAGSAVDATNFTFAGLSLGAADATRKIVVTTFGRKSDGIATVLPISISVGGITATQIVEQLIEDSPGSPVESGTAMWWAEVPTGTNADVVVNYDGTQLRAAVSIYRIVGDGVELVATDTESVDDGSAISTSLTVNAGGSAIHALASAGIETVTWTGPTEDAGDSIESFTYSSASGASATATGTLSVGTRDIAMVSASFAEATPSTSGTLGRLKYFIGMGRAFKAINNHR